MLNILKKKAEGLKRKVILPESRDVRVLRAAEILYREKTALPVLIGNREEISSLADFAGTSIGSIETVDPLSCPYKEELAELYLSKRKTADRELACRILRKEIFFGGMMLASGRADAIVAGASATTANVVKAAAMTAGYAPGVSTPSSFFLVSMPGGRTLFFADCGINADPDPAQLAEIGVTTGRNFEKITGEKARIAFLSFSTMGSASHRLVEKVREAVRIARQKDKNLCMDGEFQADTALSRRVAGIKLKQGSPVAGNANVLIFPDLNSGNISYKIAEQLAGAFTLGPVLQGFSKPWGDVSRGAEAAHIAGVAAITCLMS